MYVRESAGLALLAFCLIAGQSEVAGVTDCDELVLGIADDAVIELENSFTCSTGITIGAGISVTISGEDNVISLDTDLDSDTNDALFYNKGTLTLTGVGITTLDGSEVYARAVYNEGELTVTDCSFESLNIRDDLLSYGGAIYSDSTLSVTIEETSFTSNVAGEKGGAIYAIGTETLTITDCDFTDNEAGITDNVSGSGGDIYATDEVTLKVVRSTFTGSSSDVGGAAIECCGATINECAFIGSEANSDDDEHYGGALLVGRPDSGGCSNELVVFNSSFSSCSVNSVTGVGGSIAIFDTDASISESLFESSRGTAVFFQSSSSNGIKVESSKFYENSEPAVAYAYDGVSQASAFVIQYTGEDDDAGPAASFDTIFCYANDPYECEFLYNEAASIGTDGEFKCQICSLEGDRLFVGVDEDELVESDDAEDESSSSKDSNTGIVVGLSLALGVTLVVIGALAVWKVRVRNNARRLMEDMGDNDI